MPVAEVLEEKQTRELPLSIRAEFNTTTIDREKRTIDMVFSTGAPVRRSSWYDGDWIEELSVDAKHVRLERLNAGAPLLDTHYGYSVQSLLGSVVAGSVRIVKNEGRSELVGTVRFNERAVEQGVWRDVEQGHLKACSIGYRIHKKVLVEEREGQPPRYRVEDWDIFEVSMVTMGADPEAGVRSEKPSRQLEPNPCVLVRAVQTREEPMPQITKPDVSTTTQPDEAQRAAIAAAAEEAATREAERQDEIRSLCTQHKLGEDFARKLTSAVPRMTVDQARKSILEELARRDALTPTDGQHSGFQVGRSGNEKLRDAMCDGLLLRGGRLDLNAPKDSPRHAVEGAREFSGMSLVRFAALVLKARGIDTDRMTDVEIAERAVAPAHGTDDFPNIAANVMNKSLQAGFVEAPLSYLPIAEEEQFTNFLPKKTISVGTLTNLQKTGQQGEVRYLSLGDTGQTWAVADYTGIFALTRAMILNDTISAFTVVPFLFGDAGNRLQSDIVWGLITAEQIIEETGQALFHASHLNTGTGPIDVTGLQTAYEKMSTQKSPQGATLAYMPRYIGVPTSRTAVAIQYTGSVNPIVPSGINPFGAGSPMPLVPIFEPRLNAKSTAEWYAFAISPLKPIKTGKLAGQSSVYLESRMGFERDGIEFKGRHTFGATIAQFRQIYRSTGS